MAFADNVFGFIFSSYFNNSIVAKLIHKFIINFLVSYGIFLIIICFHYDYKDFMSNASNYLSNIKLRVDIVLLVYFRRTLSITYKLSLWHI